jgi:phage head maturation protease
MNCSRPFELAGYAAIWHAESIDGRDYVLGAGCFGWWLRQALSVNLLFDHRERLKLASTSDGTLRLWEDGYGLAFSATIPPAKLPVIEQVIARGEIGTSLGALRVLDSHLGFLSGRPSVDGAIGQIVTRAVVHECTVTDAPAFPDGRVWHVGAEPYNLTPPVRAQRGRWLARCPVPHPAAVKAKPAKQSAPKPHRRPDKTTQLNECMPINELMARYSPRVLAACHPLQRLAREHVLGYMSRMPR